MMQIHVKHISQYTVEEAPESYLNISNFNSCPSLMVKHGFYPLIVDDKPEGIKSYQKLSPLYELIEGESPSVLQRWEVQNTISMEGLKLQVCMELKARRNKEEEARLPVPGMPGVIIDADVRAVQRLTLVLDALDGTDHKIQWTFSDNTTHEIGVPELKAVVAAIAMRGDSVHHLYRNLANAVLQSTDMDWISSVTWETELP